MTSSCFTSVVFPTWSTVSTVSIVSAFVSTGVVAGSLGSVEVSVCVDSLSSTKSWDGTGVTGLEDTGDELLEGWNAGESGSESSSLETCVLA